MKKDTDTNFGWWADKPQRSDRANMKSHWNGLVGERQQNNVWGTAMLIVALVLALGCSLVYLAA